MKVRTITFRRDMWDSFVREISAILHDQGVDSDTMFDYGGHSVGETYDGLMGNEVWVKFFEKWKDK